ncbi:Z1 domain-containing protein [Roseomonas populi]|uniref:Z1 domain-containing protein n=1 Tax=Roseomonas populi TaxID=3121582 RepID=A0ABT1X4V7_9PROT|nr:Z1 domain-containing protein [Roseomonas pecuniae]MCR0983140.1 Z1 domain-containing protein [Roseomonas pecuniae]
MTPDQITAMAGNRFPAHPPTEAQIVDFLTRLKDAFQLPEKVVEDARRTIHARFAIRMEMGDTLRDSAEHAAWLNPRRASIDPFYWTRYREFLIERGWSAMVAATLDKSTDEMLDLLGDPISSGQWRRRGLVVGDVQSGKTATYAALICKAADAGYRMIILLTGILENVRRQTQERLDESFIGYDSSDFLNDTKVKHRRPVGVGLKNAQRFGVVFTSKDRDFQKAAASALNISLGAVNEPVLVVMKKNKAVLERLASWLRARNPTQNGRIALPMLLIDDEADNASINTKSDPNETTAINKAIRDLLGLFDRSSYVGFTATPFANIFIDPDSTHEMLDDDLFPRDFIHVLKPPGNYVGMHRLFNTPNEGTDEELDHEVIRTVTDADEWMPDGHKKDHELGPLPASLRDAVFSFLLATAIRDLRAAAGAPGNGGGIHRSMLVNVSRFTAVQNTLAVALHDLLEQVRRAVRLYGELPPDRAARDSPEVADLERMFIKEFMRVEVTWPMVLRALHTSMAPITVQAVNQSTGAKSLDYTVAKEAPGTRVIAVGGNSLSRGLTLEGLTTSYFLRDSRAYDTLLQMGRWFGYRDGYEDLCRIWLTTDARGMYRKVTEATLELKSDFTRMILRKATPREFGLRVRTHPGTLLITARNKMLTGRTIAIQRDISLTGRGIESPLLYAGKTENERNVAEIEKFVNAMGAKGINPAESPFKGALVWREVPAELVAAMLERFAVHPMNYDFQPDSIAEFVRRNKEQGNKLALWTVAMPTGGQSKTKVIEFPALADFNINASERVVKHKPNDRAVQISGKSARVGGKSDLRHAFTLGEYEELTEEGQTEDEPSIRDVMSNPLLILYPIRGVVRDKDTRTPYREGMLLPALGMHFPGKPSPDSEKELVHYRLNRVAQRSLLPETDAEDDDVLNGQDDVD